MNYNYISASREIYKNIDVIDEFYNQKKKEAYYSDLTITKLPFSNLSVSLNDLTFKTNDGATIYAKYIYPTTQKIEKVLLLFHGYHVSSGAWFDKLCFAQFGIAVLALDCRGQSGNSQDNTITYGSTMKGLVIKGVKEGHDNLHMVRQYLDTYLLSNIANQLHPNCKQIAMGESQGGALALACASLSTNIDFCITQYPYLCDIEHAYQLNKGYAGLEDYFRWEDPTGDTYDYIFSQLEYIDIKNLVHNITSPVQMYVGNKDIVCPPECQFIAYNNINSDKAFKIYHEYGHEYLQGAEDHKLKLILDL